MKKTNQLPDLVAYLIAVFLLLSLYYQVELFKSIEQKIINH